MRNISKVLIVLLVPAIVFGMTGVGMASWGSPVDQGEPDIDGEVDITLTAQERAVLFIEDQSLEATIFEDVDFDESDYVADTEIKVNANVDVDLEMETDDDEGFGEEFLDEWVEFHLTDEIGEDEGDNYEANVSPGEENTSTWDSFVGPGSNETNFGVWVEIPDAGDAEDGDFAEEWYDFDAEDGSATETITLTVKGAN